MKELARITKPGGFIFSAIINRLCPLRDMMFRFTEAFVAELKDDFEELRSLARNGIYLNHSEDPNAFTDAYFAPVQEIPSWDNDTGVKMIEAYSCQGIAGFLKDKAAAIHADSQAWGRFLALLAAAAPEPSMLGASEHSVFIGQK